LLATADAVADSLNATEGEGPVNIDLPWTFDARGQTASTSLEDHVTDMIKALLLTNPGERVNRPDFGSGLRSLVFAANSMQLGASLQFGVQAALERYLGDLIELADVLVENLDERLELTIKYRLRSRASGELLESRVTLAVPR
jgi:uncharacterized protein